MHIEPSHKGEEHKRMPLRQLQINHMTDILLLHHPIDLYIELDLSFGESMLLLLGVDPLLEGFGL